MTRAEEIKNEAKLKSHDIAGEVDYKSSAAYDGFVMGAKWADKTMLDRACEWLKENMYVEHIFEYDEDDEPVQYVCASVINSVDEFITAFRQAMEGGVE